MGTGSALKKKQIAEILSNQKQTLTKGTQNNTKVSKKCKREPKDNPDEPKAAKEVLKDRIECQTRAEDTQKQNTLNEN